MQHYEYATKEQKKPWKDKIIELIRNVQKDLAPNIKFEWRFSGSESLNLVTYDPKTNVGFDFDIDIEIKSIEDGYSPKTLRLAFKNSFDRFGKQYGFAPCQENKRVITIKKIDRPKSRIIFSCDFAIVKEQVDENGYLRQQILVHDKVSDQYIWNWQPMDHDYFYEQVAEIKAAKRGYWNEVRELYIKMKNNNAEDEDSDSLRREAVNEIYQEHFN